ncbi:MAG: hypothetical protein HQ572_03325 [Candidatus Omnitrophica bacterium]|nr:hypothetical protein [Candidatus Omnitrophota bacterium]
MAQNAKESIAKTKEFIELWVKFSQIYKAAMGKTTITQEEEQSFLETKSIIARKFQTLADSLSIDRFTMDRTYDVINQILSLKSISTLSEQALKKIENDWHEAYISLNRLLGHLEAQKENSPGENVITKASRSIGKTIMYSLMVLVLVLVMLFLAYILGILK